MNLRIRVRYLKSFKSDLIQNITRYRSDDQFVDMGAEKFTDDQLAKLYEQASADKGKEGARALCQRITAYRNVKANPTGNKIGKLEALATALRAYIAPSPNKWLFHDEVDGHSLPYYVSSIAYSKGDPKHGTQASVDMHLAAITRGEKDGKDVRFHIGDLGKTVTEILNDGGFYLETEAAVEQYQKDIELYKRYAPLTGAQFKCVGVGFSSERYYSHRATAMEREGVPATLVMDDATDEEESHSNRRGNGTMTSSKYWEDPTKDDDGDDESSDEPSDGGESPGAVATPVHPYVKMFDLARHSFVTVHVGNLSPYQYDNTAADKLVLSRDVKDLVSILVQGSADILEDIIQGKTGGTIVIATGPPGTGKTLTAEVFAEEMKCPLYVVQCSQLGTDEETVEKQLQKVLARASRWRAILLIDEADVYVHTRGTDIRQNAIVGVFLRVLEYYRGVLFLTSNRSTIIDDAILSRATAWIRYDYPNAEQLTEIWTVLSKQYGMPLTSEMIQRLVSQYPRISGRNVKNMLKLSRKLYPKTDADNSAQTKRRFPFQSLDVDVISYVTRFLDIKPDDAKPT